MEAKSLAVFGATGGLGREVVAAALSAGFEVCAHARTPSKLRVEHPRLRVVQGDLADEASISEAIEGTVAVLSCVGHVAGESPEAYGAGMQRILGAMQAHGVRRILAISGAGLELPGDETGWSRRFIITVLKLFARSALAGKEAEWAVIRDAEVDWTVVRVARMLARPAAGEVAVDLRRVSGSPLVAYADVAAWMVEQVDDSTYVREAPFLSGA